MLFYDPRNKKWIHTDKDAILTFGKNEIHVPFAEKENEQSCLSFHLKRKSLNAGPLIGIMTSERNNGSLAGNGPLFASIQTELTQRGGLSFVFTSESLKDDGADGYLFVPSENKWIPASFPLPHLVYNRIPFRKSENSLKTTEAFHKLKENKVPFFNPGFIDKYELYNAALTDPEISIYFPETILIDDMSLRSFLEKHKSLYLKPCLSSKGSGIFRLKKIKNGNILFEEKKKKYVYSGFEGFWEEWSSVLLKKKYLAQQEIIPFLNHGRRFDFRILAHSDTKQYQVTGVGVRQAERDQLTTHLLNGGELIPYEQVQNADHDQFIHTIVNRCGKLLSKKFGFFGEFSIDAGISRTGQYYIYEINSKPMKFDEEEIESKRVKNLCSLFFKLTGFD
jgi:hypothetical protein